MNETTDEGKRRQNTVHVVVAMVLIVALIVAAYSLGFADLSANVNVATESEFVDVYIVRQTGGSGPIYYTQGPVVELSFGDTPVGSTVSFRIVVHNTGLMTLHDITWGSTLFGATADITDSCIPVCKAVVYHLGPPPSFSHYSTITSWPITLDPNYAFVADYSITISISCPQAPYSWTLSFIPQY